MLDCINTLSIRTGVLTHYYTLHIKTHNSPIDHPMRKWRHCMLPPSFSDDMHAYFVIARDEMHDFNCKGCMHWLMVDVKIGRCESSLVCQNLQYFEMSIVYPNRGSRIIHCKYQLKVSTPHFHFCQAAQGIPAIFHQFINW